VRGDCSIRINGLGFTADEIAACSARSGLLSIELELSAADRCACTHCSTRTEPATVLSLEDIFGLFEQAKQLGARRVILIDSVTGPYPHLRTLIESLTANQMEVELIAGDTAIPPELATFLFQKRVNLSVDLAGWSLERPSMAAQAPNPVFDRLRNVGYGTPDAPNLAVRISANGENLETIPAIWRWARNNNIDPHLQIIKPGNGSDPLAILSPYHAKKLFEDLGEIDRLEFNRTWELPPSLTGRSCKRHLFATHIGSCGTVYSCVGVTIPLGTIRAESLRDILTQSEVIEDIRAFSDKVKEPCRTCSKTVDCYGCRGAAYQLTGDYLSGDQMCWKADGIPIESLPVDVGRLIPHGPSIRMVDQLVQIGERRAATSSTVANDSPWLDERGQLDELAYVEIIAQSFAAIHGFHLTAEQLARHKGLLLGITNMTISNHARAGDKLTVEIRKMTRFGQFGIVEGEVRHDDGRLIAVGQLKVWRPSEEDAAMMVS
jgi:radical SAM protein with 4Fe4S-binding SPASM domain